MNKTKCKYGYVLKPIDIEEIEAMPNKIGYCPLCHKEINLNQLPKEVSMKVDKEKIERGLQCIKHNREKGCEDCGFYHVGKLVDCFGSTKHIIEILELVKNKKEI